MSQENEIIESHSFVFSENAGGESLRLVTKMISNGDPGEIFLNQELTLHSYCNSATLNLTTALFTPEKLRELANQLESSIIKAKMKAEQ